MIPATLLGASRRLVPVLAGLTCLTSVAVTAGAASAGGSPVPVLQSFDRLPLQFEPNRGQADSRFGFLARGPRHTIYLGPTEMVVALYPVQLGRASSHPPRKIDSVDAIIRVSMLGASAGHLVGEQVLPGTVNYFVGSEPAGWQTGLPAYRRVVCAGVYPGIDVAYYGDGARFEYDFIVAPGARPEVIALRFDGADLLEIDARGDLLVHVGNEILRQHKPVAYQTIKGRRCEVSASFRLHDSGTITFALGDFDSRHELVIDPVLSYSTYFGGSRNDAAWAVAVDSSGGVYLGGTTFSTALKGSPGTNVVQPLYAGSGGANGDAFVAKLNPAGTAYEYVTYLGGRNNDAIFGIAVDDGGNAYVTGYTDSVANYRATNEVCETTCTNLVCGPPACRTRVTQTTSLVPFSVTTNVTIRTSPTETNVILKITTTRLIGAALLSAGFPVVNAYQPFNGGTNNPSLNLPLTDAFVAKLDPTGSALIYSTYLGGNGAEAGYAIAVDAAGRAHVAGYTDSGVVFRATNEVCTTVCTNDFSGEVGTRSCGETKCVRNVVFTGSLEPVLTLTNVSAVVSNGMLIRTIETIVTTTFLGATQLNVVGFPTANAIQPNNGGITSFRRNGTLQYAASLDGFVSTLSADGSRLLQSTYLGGSFDEQAFGIACDGAGNATVCGWTRSDDFPLHRPFQPALYGVQDGFIAKLDVSGSSFIYSTYLGGEQGDFANRVTLDPAGNAYVVGSKSGNGFPSTPEAYNRGGVFRSMDAGATWSSSSSGLAHPLVQALAFLPASPSTIYAGTQRGVFKSGDGGATWENRSLGIRTLMVNAIAIDPVFPSVVYAGTSGNLYRSLDGGVTWLAANEGLRNLSLTSIAIDPTMSATVYCGTRGGGVSKSTNAALNWKHSSDGLGNSSVNALVIDPQDPTLLYAATQGGIFKSTNSGARWRGTSSGLSSQIVRALAIDPSDSALLYAGTTRGLFRSTNAGANWESLTNGLGRPFVTALAIHPLEPATVFAGTTNGIFRSFDAGNSWIVATNGLHPRNVASLALDASTVPATLYTGLWATNTFGGTNDIVLVKLLPDGSALSYAVVFGGELGEQGWDVAVDGFGAACVVGQTISTRFPVTNAPTSRQVSLAGRTDAFVTRFNPQASALDYSFYLGGSGNDFGYGVAVDGAANVYVTGTTFSSAFPTTNAVQPKLAGSSDAFLAKVVGNPTPNVVRAADRLIVSWPASATGFGLEASQDDGATWYGLPQVPDQSGGQIVVTLPTTATSLRLRLSRR